jgi:hypothetical protein
MFFPPPPTTNTSISKKSISGPIGVTKITQSESSASLLATAYSIGPKIEYQTEINELTTSDNNMVQSDAFPVTDGMSFENAAAFKEKINEVGVVTVSPISALLLPRFCCFFTFRAYKFAIQLRSKLTHVKRSCNASMTKITLLQ